MSRTFVHSRLKLLEVAGVFVVFFSIGTIMIYGSWDELNVLSRSSLILLSAVLFGTFAVALRRKVGEKIEVDDFGIANVVANGQKLTLNWNEVEMIKERPIAQRLELHGRNSFVVLKLPNQLKNFDELRALIMERLDWKKLCSPNSEATLPATLYRIRGNFVVFCFGTATFAGTAFALFLFKLPVLGFLYACMVAFFVVLWLIDWTAIKVDGESITLRYPFRFKRVPIEEIEDVSIRNVNGSTYAVHAVVFLRLRNSRTLRLDGLREGSLALYRALLAARERRVNGCAG